MPQEYDGAAVSLFSDDEEYVDIVVDKETTRLANAANASCVLDQ